MRFLLLLAAVGLVLGRWDDLRFWVDQAWDRILGAASAPQTISPDTEYFCPMCPGVVTRWPEKCPVCKMPLVRRQKGDAGIIPNGVTARMQLTPYRIQLAGVRTVPATYRPLTANIQASGRFLESTLEQPSRTAEVFVSAFDAPMVRVGQAATVQRLDVEKPGRVWAAIVERIDSREEPTASDGKSAKSSGGSQLVILKATGDEMWPIEAQPCVATIATPLAERKPFTSIPHDPPPLADDDVRVVYSCPEHSEYLFLSPGKCWFDENDLVSIQLATDERLEWWCPAHDGVQERKSGHSCAQCDGKRLLPRVVTYWPSGQVLTVPDTAVVHRGTTAVVFVETAPGMFDGRAVELGPAADGYVSVVHGIAAGEKVAATSAFLLDAETRLNPAVASAYFGASNNAAATDATASALSPSSATVQNFDKFSLSPRDKALASLQRICPVTRLPLGSMGAPIAVTLPDRTFYMCCEGCRSQLPKRTQAAAKPRQIP